MKDIDSLTTTDNCNVIASIQPSRLNIDYEGRSIVSIDLATGEVDVQDEAHQVDAARIFWGAISVYGRNIVKERDEAIALLRKLHPFLPQNPDATWPTAHEEVRKFLDMVSS